MLTVDGETYKMSITQHDNAILNFKLEDETLSAGDKVLFLAKKTLDQDDYDIEVEVTEFTDGIAKIFISEHDTLIEAGTYYYSICVHTNDGRISTVISSKLKVIAGVHK